jgi:hypothetical protein
VKISQLQLEREIIAVCYAIIIKRANAPCGQNVDILNVNPDGELSNQWFLYLNKPKNNTVNPLVLPVQEDFAGFCSRGSFKTRTEFPDSK